MKIGFAIGPGVTVSWRADADDIPGFRRLEMLRRCTGMAELEDDGTASCRVVVNVDKTESICLRNHLMRIEFSDGMSSVSCAFRDPGPTVEHPDDVVWRGVRKLLFAGLIPHMLRRECHMMHGALLENGGRAVVVSGPSGIGKSTTAQRMSGRFRILADDCLLLCRSGNGWMARPLPTWSVYLFAKPSLAVCDSRMAYPVSRLLILGRSAAKYTPLPPEKALLGVAPAFTDMIQWYKNRLPEPLCRALRDAALDAAAEAARSIPCGALQLTLDCDIFGLLPLDMPEGESPAFRRGDE